MQTIRKRNQKLKRVRRRGESDMDGWNEFPVVSIDWDTNNPTNTVDSAGKVD